MLLFINSFYSIVCHGREPEEILLKDLSGKDHTGSLWKLLNPPDLHCQNAAGTGRQV